MQSFADTVVVPQERPSPSKTAPVSTGGLLTALVWAIVAALLGTMNADPDLWGHTRFGLDMLRDWTLPTIDPYSFRQDVPWVNHEWLSELQMGAAYALGGAQGLFVLRTLLFGFGCATLAWGIRHVPFVPRIAVVLVSMWAAIPIATMLRPQTWSYTLVATLALLLSADRPSRRLLWIPVIFVLWVNLHGGWIVGGLLVATWTITRVSDPEWRRWTIGISVASLAATLVNPYGAEMWLFLSRTVRIGRDAQEWQPLTAAPVQDWWPWVLTAAAPAALVVARCRLGAQRILTIVALAYLSFRVVRLIPMFSLTTAIYIAPALRDIAQRVPLLSWQPTAPSRPAAALLVVPLAIVGALFLPLSAASCIPVKGSWVPDAVTASALQQASPEGKLVTEFGWGEYAIWHFGPRLRVAMDGRRETVFSDATLAHFDAMMAAEPAALHVIETERPEYIWATTERGPLKLWLVEHGYRIDVESPTAWVAVRSDQPALTAAAVTAQCFPA